MDSEILVKSIDVRDYNEESPDAEQMRRADGELLIPATSIKGVLRSQMEKIAKLRQLPVSDIEAVFGKMQKKKKKDFWAAFISLMRCWKKAVSVRHRSGFTSINLPVV